MRLVIRKTRSIRTKWENFLYKDVQIELCKHLEQLDQILANVEGIVDGVQTCIGSFTQILNYVFCLFVVKKLLLIDVELINNVTVVNVQKISHVLMINAYSYGKNYMEKPVSGIQSV